MKKIFNNIFNFPLSYTSLGTGISTLGILFLNFGLANEKIFYLNNNIFFLIFFYLLMMFNFILIIFYLIKFINNKKSFNNSINSHPSNAILISNFFTQLLIFCCMSTYQISNKYIFFIMVFFAFSFHILWFVTSSYILIKNIRTIFKSNEFINYWFYGMASLGNHIAVFSFLINNNISIQHNLSVPFSWYLFSTFLILLIFFLFNFYNIFLILKTYINKENFVPKLCFITGGFSIIFSSFNSFNHIFHGKSFEAISLLLMAISWLSYILCLFFIIFFGLKKYDVFQSNLISYLFSTLNGTFIDLRRFYDSNIFEINIKILMITSIIFTFFSLFIFTILVTKILKKMINDLFNH